jgi:ABC-2 type transport system permease protein
VGVSHFIQQIFQAFFLVNCLNLSELVRTGKMDFLIMLPINTRFVVSLRQVDLGGFVNAGSALVVMIYAANKLQLTPTLPMILGFLALCVIGISIHYCLMFSMAAISFWAVKAQGIIHGYYNLFNIARMPDDAFPRGVFRSVFTFVLPVMLVSNVPARMLTERLTSGSAFLLVGMAVACALFSEWVWRKSLKRYTSASS